MARGRGRIPVLRSHLRQGGAVCRRTARKPRCRASVRPRCAEYGPGSACASACRPVHLRAGAVGPSSRRWRSRSSPRQVATARRSRRMPRSDGNVGLPTGGCPALAFRVFIPSIRPLDGSILLAQDRSSLSINTACAFTSVTKSVVNARSLSGSSGSDLVTSSMGNHSKSTPLWESGICRTGGFIPQSKAARCAVATATCVGAMIHRIMA